MKWITAGDIKNWITGKQRNCAEVLPELIRRLIFATATTVEEINFPSGDSVATSGWDGYLKTPVASPMFPTGTSVWEIGTETSPGKKAEEDYVKRTANPLGFVQSDTSYVFVTPRSWPGRVKWQNDKRALGVWKDVRVIGVDALEQWLELAPAVALWLGRKIKGLSDGIRDIESFWEEWSVATDPKMTTEIVLGGRSSDMERIHKWIEGKASILEVRGDSPDEPFAFLYSSIMNLPEDARTRALSRCILVENIQQLRSCASTFQSPLIIVAPSECREAAGYAVEKGHHVFLSADSRAIDFRSNLMELSRPRREVIEKGLHAGGLTETEAQKLARDFGRSIPVLRRHLFRSSAKTPTWADGVSANTLIPLLLVGAWNENKEGDQEIITLLSGMSYQKYIEALRPLLTIEDSPIRNVGSIWMLKSPLDAWFMLSPHLSDEHLKTFKNTITPILSGVDPKYELDADKRWMASIYGKSNSHSEWIRTGLVESLVLIAVHTNRPIGSISGELFAKDVVREILEKLTTWEAWSSVKDITPLLAEAAPEIFMESVEKAITTNPAMFEDLMADDGTTFGECRHSGLLWALESLAWSSDYLSKALNILLILSKIDKGGRWSNRPISSLKDVFMPALPQTHATPIQRLEAFDLLVEKDSSLVWKFAQGYYTGGSISEAHRFKWRETGGTRRGLESENISTHQEYIDGLLPKLSDLACKKENITASVEEFLRFPVDIKEKIINALETEEVSSFSKDDQIKIANSLRDDLNWINSYGEKELRSEVPRLYKIYEKFQPVNLLERHGWLLNNPWPRLPQGEPKEYDGKDSAIKEEQEKAGREVLSHVPLEEILTFAGNIQYVGLLGQILGKSIANDKEDSKVLDFLIANIATSSSLIRGYSIGRIEKVGKGWVAQQIKRLKKGGKLSAEVSSLLYLGQEEGGETWFEVESSGKDVEDAYWKLASGYSRADKNEDAPMAVEKLLNANRPDQALQIAGGNNAMIPSILLQRLLQDLVTGEDKKVRNRTMEEYYLGNVFEQLYKQDDIPLEELAKLEWPYAALFDDIQRYVTFPTALHRVLKKDPLFFAQLISFIYKKDGATEVSNEEDLDEEILRRRASVAKDILHSWRVLPGVKDDGTVDEKELTEWVAEAQKKSVEAQYVVGCDIEIGFMLAHYPAESDGTWPCIPVRNLVEKLNNKVIDDHIQNEIYNSRGVVTKSIGAGGIQERGLADQYKQMAEKVKGKWPRTGALLESLSRSYNHQAKHEDIDSDLQDLRWN